MATIPPRLASELLTATGITCLRVATLAGHPGHTRVTIGGLAERKSRGVRVWLRSRKQAKTVMGELFVWHQARRSDSGIIIESDTSEVERIVRARVELLGFAPTEDEQIDVILSTLTERIETTVAQMQRDGSMKLLNREYAASLATSRPPYAEWLTERLRTEVPRFAELLAR